MIEAAILAQLVAHARLRGAVDASLTAERSEFRDRSDQARAFHRARTRWLEQHGAESSFPCGVVRTDAVAVDEELWGMREELAVFAVVLPETVTFLVDPPEGWPSPEPIEAGSVPRMDLMDAEVVDLGGSPVFEPAAESFDHEPDVVLVVSWEEGGERREQRLVFRSSWLAWRAARRVRAASVPRT